MKQLILALVAMVSLAAGQDSLTTKGFPSISLKPQTYHIAKSEPGTIEIAPDSGSSLSYVFSAKTDYQLTPEQMVQPIIRGASLIDSLQTYRPQIITIKMLEEWVRYCYDDSNAVLRGGGQCWSLDVNPPIIKYEYYDTVYIHKNPNDIPSLLEWIKGKYRPDSTMLKFREAVICSVARQQIK